MKKDNKNDNDIELQWDVNEHLHSWIKIAENDTAMDIEVVYQCTVCQQIKQKCI